VSRSKYNNVRTEYAGVRYASKAEAAYAYELDIMRQAGRINGWTGQPRFRLGCAENVFVADFVVWGKDGGAWVVDVKGVRTAKFARDVKLWRAYGPCSLHVVSGKKVEIVIPKHLGAS
jgi:hypothetical protein